MAKPRILIIEDDPDIRELLLYNLERDGYLVSVAENAEAGLASCNPDLGKGLPSLILLDIMLPGMDGLEALRRLKANTHTRALPVIMMTAKGEDADIVSGLELGADDYITKPFSPRVLTARLRTALRRLQKDEAKNEAGQVISRGPLVLDKTRHEARLHGQGIDLSATEFAVLALLLAEPGRVFTRSRIIDAVKGPDYPVTDRAVDVQIVALRKKLQDYGNHIETVRGVGYRFKDEA